MGMGMIAILRIAPTPKIAACVAILRIAPGVSWISAHCGGKICPPVASIDELSGEGTIAVG